MFDLFSKRQKRLRGEVPDVYVYDELPNPLRVQIVQIWTDAIGHPFWPGKFDHFESPNTAAHTYDALVMVIRREVGVFELVKHTSNAYEELANYFLNEQSAEAALDVVELAFRFAVGSQSNDHTEELNQRFREHGVGYQFEVGRIVRVDSQMLHAEAIKPVLHLLCRPGFQGPEQEFLTAHEHHRHGRNKECLVECLKAFESTMKVICDQRGWPCPPKATAKDLIAACFKGGLVHTWMETEFASLRQLLESSVPTVRNKTSGHGQGGVVQSVPAHLAAYGLHMTGSTILFLVQADVALGP